MSAEQRPPPRNVCSAPTERAKNEQTARITFHKQARSSSGRSHLCAAPRQLRSPTVVWRRHATGGGEPMSLRAYWEHQVRRKVIRKVIRLDECQAEKLLLLTRGEQSGRLVFAGWQSSSACFRRARARAPAEFYFACNFQSKSNAGRFCPSFRCPSWLLYR